MFQGLTYNFPKIPISHMPLFQVPRGETKAPGAGSLVLASQPGSRTDGIQNYCHNDCMDWSTYPTLKNRKDGAFDNTDANTKIHSFPISVFYFHSLSHRTNSSPDIKH